MNRFKLISVVIPTYDRTVKLKATLDSLKKQDYPKDKIEVIVVDDCSPRSPKELVLSYKGEFNKIVYLQNKKNSGPAFSRNRGIEKARGEIIFFTDDDGIASKNWISEFVKFYEKHKNVAGIGGPLTSATNNLIAKIELLKDNFLGLRKNRVMIGRNISVGFTSNMSYRKEVLDKCGYFNENYKAPAGEDKELVERVAKKFDLAYLPIEVFHNHDYKIDYLVNILLKQGLNKNPKGNLSFKIIYLIAFLPLLVFNIIKKTIKYRMKNERAL